LGRARPSTTRLRSRAPASVGTRYPWWRGAQSRNVVKQDRPRTAPSTSPTGRMGRPVPLGAQPTSTTEGRRRRRRGCRVARALRRRRPRHRRRHPSHLRRRRRPHLHRRRRRRRRRHRHHRRPAMAADPASPGEYVSAGIMYRYVQKELSGADLNDVRVAIEQTAGHDDSADGSGVEIGLITVCTCAACSRSCGLYSPPPP
jgi:hypothetical protein